MKVVAFLLSVQKRLAEGLNRRTAYWNKSSKLVALAVFCLVFGGVCLWLLVKVFIHF
jgi:hypothetical protein